MWSAIKNDLFDFVSTIKEDTTKQVSKVIGSGDDEESGSSPEDIMLSDLRRAFTTYEQPVNKQHTKDYEKFMRKFCLTNYNVDIVCVLDAEPDVSRYYAELVPAKLTAEQFWSRYYFKLELINKSFSNGVDLDGDDEEEELSWDEDGDGGQSAEATTGSASRPTTDAVSEFDSSVVAVDGSDVHLASENTKLKSCVRSLTRKIAELQSLLKERDHELAIALQKVERYEQQQQLQQQHQPVSSATDGSTVIATVSANSASASAVAASVTTSISSGSFSDAELSVASENSLVMVSDNIAINNSNNINRNSRSIQIASTAQAAQEDYNAHTSASNDHRSSVLSAEIVSLDGSDEEEEGWS